MMPIQYKNDVTVRLEYYYIDKRRKHGAINIELRSESSLECDNSGFKISYEINNAAV